MADLNTTRRDRWIGFDPTLSYGIPECEAVYVILQHGKVLYVGMAADLRSRMCDHLRCRRHPQVQIRGSAWAKLESLEGKYKTPSRYGAHAMIELRLIRRLRPSFNTQHRKAVPVGS